MNPNDAKTRLHDLIVQRVGNSPEPPPPMAELVTRLDAWLREYRPAYYANLLPGLTAEELVGFERRLGVTLPSSFCVLYQWRNGQFHDDPSFRGNRYWMCAGDIARTKELMDSLIGADFEPGWWQRSWVPFLHNGGGDHLCIDTAGTGSGSPGQLVEFWHDAPHRPVVAPSLESWLHNFIQSLERDRWEETAMGFECLEVRDVQS